MSDNPRQDDYQQPRFYPNHPQHPQHPQQPPQQPAFVKGPEFNPTAGMQIALTVLALAALPISAWLYIASYVEDRVETATVRQEEASQQALKRQENNVENLREYALNLCIGVRKIDPTFSCGSSYSSRAAYRDRRQD